MGKINYNMNILSLFDGISCGQIALNRIGITHYNYYASEIDKDAIKMTQHNYPKTIQLGDVKNITKQDLPKIDLLIGGSPCQGFSFAGKQLNFDDPRSKLFFEYIRLLKECKPKYFLLENVCMKKEYLNTITKCIGVDPVFINSKFFSAQDRKRYYWTNIFINEYIDKNISFSDIATGYAGSMRGRRINEFGKRADGNKNIQSKQYVESRQDNKTNCLTTVCKDNIVTTKKYKRTELTKCDWRYLTVSECEQLQTMPNGYTNSVSNNKALRLLGNGWTVDVIAHILNGMIEKNEMDVENQIIKWA